MESTIVPVAKKANHKVLSELDIIPFGKKHNGKTVDQVAKEDPSFIVWVHNTFDNFDFTPEVLVRCMDRQIAPISFTFNIDDLKAHLKVIGNIEQGLDPYGDRGVRQLHGFQDKENVHTTLSYFRRMADYLVDQLLDKPSLQINKS